MDNAKVYVYYDGLCRGCSSVAGSIAKSSNTAKFALVDATRDELPVQVRREAAMKDVHVRDETGRQYVGAEAVMKILEQYPRWRWLAWLGRLPVLRLVASGVYRLIADNRYWMFGRVET